MKYVWKAVDMANYNIPAWAAVVVVIAVLVIF